ncbi:MAG: cytochrome c1 [Sterolibacterium sp.]|nr:cytochrome c1 [Sterolibacterium sp.]MBP9799015.1 cytochrome c1 [Sterolibacterium sp.]
MKKLLIALLFAPLLAFASGDAVYLDKAPDRGNNPAALQNGAKVFANYCMGCHGASFMRYNRLRDIGLSEEQIRNNLIFSDAKVGELMKISMPPADAKLWFGVTPPDLTLVARARSSETGTGTDWLYTYLRGFYRDDSRPTGWNNVAFPNVGMPHALWELQGQQVMGADHKLALATPGQLKPEEYDALVADLVAYLQFMAEPVAETRQHLGVAVLIALAVLFVFAYALKREFWKDVH